MNFPSVRRNFFYRLIYEVLILVTPFITAPYVSRVLGADGVGIYSYTSSIMTYFTLFAALGTVSYGTREIAQHRDDKQAASKLFWEIELMTVMTSLACLAVWLLLILFSKEYRYYYIALLPMLFGTMFDISWYFTGYEQVKYIVLRNAFCKLSGVILLFVLVREKNDLILYMVINSCVVLLGNLSMWTYLPKMLCKTDFRQLRFRRHFQETLVYFIPTIATSIYTVLDKTLIGIITGSSYENGYYEQATKVIKIIKTMVFVSVNSVMGARISYLFSEQKYDEIHHRIERSTDFILLMGYGAVFGVVGVSSRFVPFFFGAGYEPVIQILCVMAPLILIIGVSNCLGSQYFTPSGQRKRSAKVIVLGAVINLCCNLALIPRYGAVGATIASMIAELTITVLYVRMSDRYMTAAMLVRLSWKRLLAGLLMWISVVLMDNMLPFADVIVLCFQVVVGIGIYGGTLLIMRDEMLLELFGEGLKKVRKIIK